MSTHVARIAKVDSIAPIQGADRIQTAYVLGVQVIVSKDVKPGDIGILFDAELQLSEEYCRENNLFRHKELNKDTEKTGYMEDNRRLETKKFMKVKSEALFMPVSSLEYTGWNLTQLKVGDSFAELNKKEICRKYVSERTRAAAQGQNKIKKKKAIEAPTFLPHLETEKLSYYIDNIKPGSLITITPKLEGTSGRYAHVEVTQNNARETLTKVGDWVIYIVKKAKLRKLARSLEFLFSKLHSLDFWNKFSYKSFQFLAGSRRVVLFPGQENKVGFHGPETYRFEWLEKLKPYLDKNLIVYGELVGFANGAPIMEAHDIKKLKDKKYEEKYGVEPMIYRYGCLDNENKFFVYRIAFCNPEGKLIDFSWNQVKDWCLKRGFAHVPEIYPQFIYDGNKEKLMELVTNLSERPDKLTEDYIDPRHILEGACIRVEDKDLIPSIYKYKNFAYRVMDTSRQIDAEQAESLDIETQESVTQEVNKNPN